MKVHSDGVHTLMRNLGGVPLVHSPSPGRIMVIDDEGIVASLTAEILKQYGYSVVVRTDPFEALELLRKAPAAFDLVITDQMMPGLSGLELAAEIFNLDLKIPIVLSTGSGWRDVLARASRLGIKEVVHKPFTVEELIDSVRRSLRES